MKERQDAEDLVTATQWKYLRHLLDVRADVVVREHHAFRLARAAAREDDGSEIVQLNLLLLAQGMFEYCNRQQKGHHDRSQFFYDARLGRELFDQHDPRPGGQLDLCFVEESLRCDDGFQSALLDCRGDALR